MQQAMDSSLEPPMFLAPAKKWSAKPDLQPRHSAQNLPAGLVRPMPLDFHLPLARDFPLPPEQPCRCWPDRGPCALSRAVPGEPLPYSAAWHHRHLYSPRNVNRDSDMPAYRFLYEKRPVAGERSADALQLSGPDAPAPGWEVVPSYDANCLVAYLMSLDQSHPLKEVKSGAPANAPAPSPAAAKGTK